MFFFCFFFHPLFCLHACVFLLAGSAATEERLTAESTGCLLQGATGTTGEEGKTFAQSHN